MSSEERKKIQKHEEEVRNQKHGSRLSKKVTLDIYGRQIIDEDDDIPNPHLYAAEKPPKIDETYTETDLTCPTSEFNRPQVIKIIYLSILVFI